MRLGRTKAARALLLLPLAFGLQAQRAPEDCRASAENDAHIEPILLLSTRRGLYTPVQNGSVVAEEVMQLATEGWMLADDLRLAEERVTFPAGTVVDRDHPSREPRCLPIAPRLDGEGEPRRFRNTGRLACLVDSDGDGRFEQVKMFGANYAMHVPQANLYATITLPTPIALAADPLGNGRSRRRVTRRLSIGWIDGDNVRFIVSHHFGDRQSRPDGGRWEIRPDGAQIYRLPPAMPVPLEWAGNNPSANSLHGQLVRLVDGQTIQVGGLSLAVDRASDGYAGNWTVRSTTGSFPRWLHFGCGGRSVQAGVAGDDLGD